MAEYCCNNYWLPWLQDPIQDPDFQCSKRLLSYYIPVRGSLATLHNIDGSGMLFKGDAFLAPLDRYLDNFDPALQTDTNRRHSMCNCRNPVTLYGYMVICSEEIYSADAAQKHPKWENVRDRNEEYPFFSWPTFGGKWPSLSTLICAGKICS